MKLRKGMQLISGIKPFFSSIVLGTAKSFVNISGFAGTEPGTEPGSLGFEAAGCGPSRGKPLFILRTAFKPSFSLHSASVNSLLSSVMASWFDDLTTQGFDCLTQGKVSPILTIDWLITDQTQTLPLFLRRLYFFRRSSNYSAHVSRESAIIFIRGNKV